jgi:hypothetical protein
MNELICYMHTRGHQNGPGKVTVYSGPFCLSSPGLIFNWSRNLEFQAALNFLEYETVLPGRWLPQFQSYFFFFFFLIGSTALLGPGLFSVNR